MISPMANWIIKSKSIFRGIQAVFGIRLIDPIEVFYLPSEKTFYPIISKSACSSIKVMLIQKFVPDFKSSFPEIHHIDPCSITDNQAQRIFFYQMRNYEKWTKGKKMVLVIREPASRFYSCYIDVKKGKNRMYQYPSQLDWFYEFKPGLSISAFLKSVYKINDSFADRHFRSQTFCLNTRVRKAISELEVYALDDFMHTMKIIKSDEGIRPTRLNTNNESIPQNLLSELELDLRFMKRFEEDIRLYVGSENHIGRHFTDLTPNMFKIAILCTPNNLSLCHLSI